MFSTRCIATLLVGAFLMLGCSGGGNPADPPDGWQTTETRWWEEGVDTAEVFRDLDSLSTMGVSGGEVQLASDGNITREQFNAAIKRSLVRLYRNNPMIVDSLFEEHAAPQLEDVDLSGDILGEKGQLDSKILNKNQKRAYEAITEYFDEPSRDQDPDIIWPDSLRSSEYTGVVSLQVHLSPEGEGREATATANAVEVLSGTHPTLDRIAMRAATQAVWTPAFLLRDGEWVPVESWVRFNIPFQMQ